MPLHPQAEAFLKQLAEEQAPEFNEMTVLEARAFEAGLEEIQGDPQEVTEVRNILVPGAAGEIPVRIYNPSPGETLPMVIYVHGGGWVMGSLDVVDRPCRELANAAPCIVASLGYRLSPETKFPGPVEDCYAATRWLVENSEELGADRHQIGIAGDSAGGNLAAAVTLMARDRGGPHLSFQLLIYPVTAPEHDTPHESYTINGEGYMVTRKDMHWFWNHYIDSVEECRDPYAFPLLADDFSGLPPGLVITAEFDPLRDEGAAYAEHLQRAGVDIERKAYSGAIHGFFWMNGIMDQGRELLGELADYVARRKAQSDGKAGTVAQA
jgi:acetyl esterase/lipase